MKSFVLPRPLAEADRDFPGHESLGAKLQEGIRAVSLCAHTALCTAISNDIGPEYVFAQQVWGYGKANDLLWAMSTSGNSGNVLNALYTARARGMKTLGLTGVSGGSMARLCDVCLRVSASATHRVQELHLPVSHALCRVLEARFFDGAPIPSHPQTL